MCSIPFILQGKQDCYNLTMDFVTTSRFLLPIVAILVFIIIASLTKAPKLIIWKMVSISWVTMLLVASSMAVGIELGIWHYTLNYLFFGHPLDRYLAAGIAYGSGFGLLYWWFSKFHKKYLTIFLIIVPFWGPVTDYFGTKMTRTTFWEVTNPYWLLADLVAWTISWLIMVKVYRKVLKT